MQNRWLFVLVCVLCLAGCSLQDVEVHGDSCPAAHSVMVNDEGYLVTEVGYLTKEDDRGFFYVEPQYEFCDEKGKSLGDEDKVKADAVKKYIEWKLYYDWIVTEGLTRRYSDKDDAEVQYAALKSDILQLKNIYLSDDTVCNRESTSEKCSEFKMSFKYNNCPEMYNQCGFEPRKGYYCQSEKKSCPVGQHYDDETKGCEEDDVKNCKFKGFSCEEQNPQWKDGICENGQCIVKVCIDGYAVNEDGVCVSDCAEGKYYKNGEGCVDEDINHCGGVSHNCETLVGWKQGKCEKGKCVVEECQDGFKPKDGVCVSNCESGKHYDSEVSRCVDDDINHCGSVTNNCETLAGWTSGLCENGNCVADECKSGYLLNGGQCTAGCQEGNHLVAEGGCEPDSVDNCGSHGNACSSVISGWSDGECVQGTCSASSCIEGYHLRGETCDKNTNTCCGMDGVMCIDCTKSQQICDGTACVISCGPGTGLCKDGCVNMETDVENCGECGKVCSASDVQFGTSGSVLSVKCEKRTCSVDKCSNGYTLILGKCTKTGCTSNSDCSITNGTGICDSSNECAYSCNAGYTLNGSNKCTKTGCTSDSDCSISNGTSVCNSSNECAYSCNAGYSLSGMSCVKIGCLSDDDCTTENGIGFCNSQYECYYICEEGYDVSDDGCVERAE